MCGIDTPRCIKIQMGIGIGIVAFCSIVVIFSTAIPAGRFNSAKTFPDLDTYRVDPGPVIISTHCLAWLLGIGIGIGLILAPFGLLATLLVSVISGSLGLVDYLANLAWYFSYTEWKMDYQTYPLSGFLESNRAAITAIPVYDLYVDAKYYTYKRNRPCRSKHIYVSVVDANSSEELVPLTKEIVGDGAFRVETTVKMTTDASGDEYLKGLKEQMLKCVADDRLIDPAVVVTGIIPGYDRNAIVTNSGKTPGVVSRHDAIAAGIFGCGLSYLYNVGAEVPVLRYSISKEVALNESETFTCEDIGKCVEYLG